MTINQRSKVRMFDDLRCVGKSKKLSNPLYMVLRMWYNWCVAILWVMCKTSWWCVKHHEMAIKFDLWQLRVSDFWENWLMVLEVWTLLLKAKISLVGIKPSSMVICLDNKDCAFIFVRVIPLWCPLTLGLELEQFAIFRVRVRLEVKVMWLITTRRNPRWVQFPHPLNFQFESKVTRNALWCKKHYHG